MIVLEEKVVYVKAQKCKVLWCVEGNIGTLVFLKHVVYRVRDVKRALGDQSCRITFAITI